MELIYSADYLEHAEVEYHLPIISFSIIVFVYFEFKILSVLSTFTAQQHRTKTAQIGNIKRICPCDSEFSSFYVLFKLLT